MIILWAQPGLCWMKSCLTAPSPADAPQRGPLGAAHLGAALGCNQPLAGVWLQGMRLAGQPLNSSPPCHSGYGFHSLRAPPAPPCPI